VLQRLGKKLLRITKFPGSAVHLSQFISGVGISGIDFQLLSEFLRRGGHVFRRVTLPRTRQQRTSYPVMYAGPPGINREHLAILTDGRVVRSLAFVGLRLSLMPPHGCGSYLCHLLHVEEGGAAEDSRGVVEHLRIVWIEPIQLQ